MVWARYRLKHRPPSCLMEAIALPLVHAAPQDVALLIADELHLLGGPEGPTLEVVVSRMRYISSQLEKKVGW